MNMKTLAVLTGVAAPLIATGSTSAGFIGIKVTSKPNPFGLLVCNVYAEFDRLGDHMTAVAGTPNSPLTIEVIDGTFYQHPFGIDSPPSRKLIQVFPSLAYDTFVTIGKKDNNGDILTLTTGWPGFGPSELTTTEAAWAITPDNPQGDPFDPGTFPGNGQVLIGQFATADGSAIAGTMLLQFISNGAVGQAVVSFYHVPSPGALAMMGVAGLIGTRRRRANLTASNLS